MKKLYFLIFFYLLAGPVLWAQQAGTIGGRIINEKTGAAVASATVTIANGGKATITGADGRYTLQLAPGTYSIRVSSLGYQTKAVSDVIVTSGQLTELPLTMQEQATEMTGIVITSSAKKESDASVLVMQKNNASISDGISTEAIRRSPDRNVGEVLKRVSGTSIQEDKFIVVRGLSDRYNVALINGALMPSTEPDRRAFSFDIVPAALIDNIMINKTATPDMPGDFSGGIVQVTTKDIPFKSFLSISAGSSYNSIATGKPFQIGILEPTDYLGFDNGTRKLPGNFPSRNRYLSYNTDADPARRLAASRLMRNNYGDRYTGSALPGFNFGINWGGRKDLTNGATLGSVVALTYRNAQTISYNERRDYQTEDGIGTDPGNLFFDYKDTSYSFTTNIGLMANVAYRKGATKITWKNLANRLFEQTNLRRSGYNYDNLQYVQVTGSVPVIKSLISSQLEGEHRLSGKDDKFKWNINYALTARDQPDYRVLPYAKNLDDVGDKSVNFKVVLRDTYRYWSTLTDHAFGGQLHYALPLTFFAQKQTLKGGLVGQYKIRNFNTRIFRYEQASSTLNPALTSMPANTIFNDGHIYEQGFVLGEITNNTDKYDARSGLYAGYIMIDGRLSDKLRAIYGARVEYFGFDVNTANFSGEKVHVDKRYIDILPSLNLTYSLTNKTALRFSASRTVSRPELRELANFAYYDFVRNAQLKGNTDLQRSQNTNLDLRFETYPSGREIISASVFYKHFSKPIEQVVMNGATPSNLILSFTNPDAATTLGAEVEVRKHLGFISDGFENLAVNLNASIMKSTVSFNENSNAFDSDRPLQGLSPWLLNAGLQYTLPGGNLSFSGLVNRIGHRIAAVGFQGYPDIYENGRTVIDLQATAKLLKGKAELKLGVSDLMNQRAVFYQNVRGDGSTSFDASKDRVQYNFLYGRTVSFGLSYNFF